MDDGDWWLQGQQKQENNEEEYLLKDQPSITWLNAHAFILSDTLPDMQRLIFLIFFFMHIKFPVPNCFFFFKESQVNNIKND